MHPAPTPALAHPRRQTHSCAATPLPSAGQGSAYIHTTSNVFAYADNGLKSDFGGHDHVWEKNLLLYVNNWCAFAAE